MDKFSNLNIMESNKRMVDELTKTDSPHSHPFKRFSDFAKELENTMEMRDKHGKQVLDSMHMFGNLAENLKTKNLSPDEMEKKHQEIQFIQQMFELGASKAETSEQLQEVIAQASKSIMYVLDPELKNMDATTLRQRAVDQTVDDIICSAVSDPKKGSGEYVFPENTNETFRNDIRSALHKKGFEAKLKTMIQNNKTKHMVHYGWM